MNLPRKNIGMNQLELDCRRLAVAVQSFDLLFLRFDQAAVPKMPETKTSAASFASRLTHDRWVGGTRTGRVEVKPESQTM